MRNLLPSHPQRNAMTILQNILYWDCDITSVLYINDNFNITESILNYTLHMNCYGLWQHINNLSFVVASPWTMFICMTPLIILDIFRYSPLPPFRYLTTSCEQMPQQLDIHRVFYQPWQVFKMSFHFLIVKSVTVKHLGQINKYIKIIVGPLFCCVYKELIIYFINMLEH